MRASLKWYNPLELDHELGGCACARLASPGHDPGQQISMRLKHELKLVLTTLNL